jgi:hypothetical protein
LFYRVMSDYRAEAVPVKPDGTSGDVNDGCRVLL